MGLLSSDKGPAFLLGEEIPMGLPTEPDKEVFVTIGVGLVGAPPQVDKDSEFITLMALFRSCLNDYANRLWDPKSTYFEQNDGWPASTSSFIAFTGVNLLTTYGCSIS